MHHLSRCPEGFHTSLCYASDVKTWQGSSRCFELNHILHCLCGPPSIPLGFNLAVVLPRWITYCVNCGTEGVNPPTPSNHRLRHGLPGYLILFATHAFEPQRQLVPVDRLRHWCSSRYLRIPPLHREFHLPLHYSRKTVLKAIHGLSPWFSLPTCLPACAPFTPSNSGQRLHPTFYRGCWHVVSRCFLVRYRHYRP